MLILSAFFWVCVFLLAYVFLGYPVLMYFRAVFRRYPHHPISGFEPEVSLVIVAYNEASRVCQRLENILSLDFPRNLLEIVFVSDGSTDRTVEQAWNYAEAGVKVISFGARRGKPAVLNDVIPKLKGKIVVFADARQRFKSDVLRSLVKHFSDPKVGAVSGELILTKEPKSNMVKEGLGFYWHYEKFIRRLESKVDSTVGATGAIYAIRRDLFEPLPKDTLLDDVLIPMRIVRKGYRVLFDPQAKAYDRLAATAREEFTRKIRTITGNFQLFTRECWLLNPFRNRLWFQSVSHKGLRLLIPLFIGGAFVTNIILADIWLYQWCLALQVLFYSAAFGGAVLQRTKRRVPLLSVPYAICLLTWATVVAFWQFITGGQSVTWAKESPIRDRHRGAVPVGTSAETSRFPKRG